MIRLICMTDFTEQYAYKLLHGILKYSQEAEPWVICRMPPEYKRKKGIMGVAEWAKNWNADAILGQFDETDDISIFRKNRIVVIAQDYKKRFRDIPNITSNYLDAGRMAAEFFTDKGFRNFAFYGYDNVVWSDERGDGFKEYLINHGYGDSLYEYRKQSLDELWHYQSEELEQWLMSLPHSTALLAADDTMASKIVEQCHALKLKIPTDVSVLGVDNDIITCELTYPELSSMMMDVTKAGYETAKLIKEMKEHSDYKGHDINVELIGVMERSSTDFFAARNPYIQKALVYIHTNISREIHVSDIIKEIPMSRRQFEQKFREETSTTPHNYITSLRMDRLSQMLITTDEPIEDLAMAVGAGDVKNLSRQFKASKGMTPIEYRKNFK